MASIVNNVYNFFPPTSALISSMLSLAAPSFGKCIFSKQYDQVWKWPVHIIALSITSLSLGTSVEAGLMISLALLSVGNVIAHYAFPQPIPLESLYTSIVWIENSVQDGSGVLIKHERFGDVLITVEHVVKPDSIAHIGGEEVALSQLDVYSSGPNVRMFVLSDTLQHTTENAPVIRENVELIIGEKVYFGGYPFGKTEPHLHMGHVSSIGKGGTFSIDGTAVPGMSGGPIAVERGGKLCVIGAINSETFDPIEGFSNALNKMYLAQESQETEQAHLDELTDSFNEFFQQQPKQRAPKRIKKGELLISNLYKCIRSHPNIFNEIWDDLHQAGVIFEDGKIDSEKIIPGKLGLRAEYQEYEQDIIDYLEEEPPQHDYVDSSQINWPFAVGTATDSVNTVGLSLVQSLSTGIISGDLLRGFSKTSLQTF